MRPDFFKILPSDVVTSILLRLSVRSIAISKCVCKPWLHLLQTDHFVKSHFAKSTPALALSVQTSDSNWFHVFELEEDELDLDRRYDPLTRFGFAPGASIVGSANGLLLVHDFDYHNNTLYVCNPITREFLCLLPCPQEETDRVGLCGFGVSRISGQYKVVYVEGKKRGFMCHVYTLGTGGSWRRIEATDLFDWRPGSITAPFVQGNLHWMESSEQDHIERIFCFDLETERFSSLTVPPLGRNRSCRCLYALRDSLGFCDESSDGGGIAIWMMKEYGDEKSWSMEYVITLNPGLNVGRGGSAFMFVHPKRVFENGDVLILIAGGKFMYYSKKTKTVGEFGGFFGAAAEKFYLITSMFVTPSMLSLQRFSGMENVISF